MAGGGTLAFIVRLYIESAKHTRRVGKASRTRVRQSDRK